MAKRVTRHRRQKIHRHRRRSMKGGAITKFRLQSIPN